MALNAYLNKRVSVLTLDGRTMVGLLHSCDGSMNLVLQEAVERIIRPIEDEEPSEEVPLGLYIIRGDSSWRGARGNETYLKNEKKLWNAYQELDLEVGRRGSARGCMGGTEYVPSILHWSNTTNERYWKWMHSDHKPRQTILNGGRIYMHIWRTRYPRKRKDTLNYEMLLIYKHRRSEAIGCSTSMLSDNDLLNLI
ncbi:uncharacterized protein ALTATR162_LOCUS6203 [Alternaria atra]|uniref:LSM2-LSM8 complex subunit LSM8 n=1 Tax=Alternaria atra TaxID=119953 RepID=A0A8J2I2I5_9PLEO|nr:uncharacterized protein ALTATR162_LOCUS6203 [Alternaria atra]CAG5162347.1 unnamed protein product [Alternaria atra]